MGQTINYSPIRSEEDYPKLSLDASLQPKELEILQHYVWKYGKSPMYSMERKLIITTTIEDLEKYGYIWNRDEVRDFFFHEIKRIKNKLGIKILKY
jgi:hypothetical protein